MKNLKISQADSFGLLSLNFLQTINSLICMLAWKICINIWLLWHIKKEDSIFTWNIQIQDLKELLLSTMIFLIISIILHHQQQWKHKISTLITAMESIIVIIITTTTTNLTTFHIRQPHNFNILKITQFNNFKWTLHQTIKNHLYSDIMIPLAILTSKHLHLNNNILCKNSNLLASQFLKPNLNTWAEIAVEKKRISVILKWLASQMLDRFTKQLNNMISQGIYKILLNLPKGNKVSEKPTTFCADPIEFILSKLSLVELLLYNFFSINAVSFWNFALLFFSLLHFLLDKDALLLIVSIYSQLFL